MKLVGSGGRNLDPFQEPKLRELSFPSGLFVEFFYDPVSVLMKAAMTMLSRATPVEASNRETRGLLPEISEGAWNMLGHVRHPILHPERNDDSAHYSDQGCAILFAKLNAMRVMKIWLIHYDTLPGTGQALAGIFCGGGNTYGVPPTPVLHPTR